MFALQGRLIRTGELESAKHFSFRYLAQLFAASSRQQQPHLYALENLATASAATSCLLQQLRIVYKPHGWHSAAQRHSDGLPCLQDFLLLLPHAPAPALHDGGLIQRLDFLTAGLLLQTSDPSCYQQLLELQQQRRIRKFYAAWSPMSPRYLPNMLPECKEYASYFRPYGPKGREVRIVPPPPPSPSSLAQTRPSKQQKSLGPYRTCIEQAYSSPAGSFFAVSLDKGFRHQVRAQLAYLGYPLGNDPIYLGNGPIYAYPNVQANRTAHFPSHFPALGLVACGLEIQLGGDFTLQIALTPRSCDGNL